MHRKGENFGLFPMDPGGSISLVNIQIDNHRPPDPRFGPELSQGNRNIIEDAKPGSIIRERMMCPTSKIAGNSQFQCQPSGHQRASGRGKGSGDQAF